MNEKTKISALKGIGEKTEQNFQKMEIYTVGAMLHHYPRGYDVY